MKSCEMWNKSKIILGCAENYINLTNIIFSGAEKSFKLELFVTEYDELLTLI